MRKTLMIPSILVMAALSGPAISQTRTAAAKPIVQAPAAKPTQAAVQLPPPEAMIIMIRSSILALSQANLTNNYTVLNALGSPSFRIANSPQKLSESFASFRSNQIDLAPVTLIQPQLTQPARIEDGKLRLVGLFPSQPMRINYDLTFEVVAGRWALQGIGINLDRAIEAPPVK